MEGGDEKIVLPYGLLHYIFRGISDAIYRIHTIEEFLGTLFIGDQVRVGEGRSAVAANNFRVLHRAKMCSQETQ